MYDGPDKQYILAQEFDSVLINLCYSAQMNHLIEEILLSTHNICFG